MANLERNIVIIGAGCFGLSTAYHLLKRGYANVTVLDRSNQLPAPDAASTDLNKIVRSGYEDPFYCKLAREAIREWKNKAVWGDTYHESGYLVTGAWESEYGELTRQNDEAEGARITFIEKDSELRELFPSDIPLGEFIKAPALMSFDGGWASAQEGIEKAIANVEALDGKVIPGKKVINISRDVNGSLAIASEDGSSISADVVVIATGSWTASSFVGLGVGVENKIFASGNGIATVQLTEDEAQKYKDVPVVLDVDSGFYIFPPDKDNIVKFAAHGAGYINIPEGTTVSTPRTVLSHGEAGLKIPREMSEDYKKILEKFYPGIADKEFERTRMCWYTYTSDSNWIIDALPDDPDIFFATGGSGHAYKFLPVVGRLVADKIEGKLPEKLNERFSYTRDRGAFKNWGWFSEPRHLDEAALV